MPPSKKGTGQKAKKASSSSVPAAAAASAPPRASSAPLLRDVEVKCHICRQTFEQPRRFHRADDSLFSKIPKLLDCLHTYCQSCIQDAIERVPAPAYFTCPICNKRHSIPDLMCGTSALTNDFTVLRALREREESKGRDEDEGEGDLDCDECVDSTLATHRCLDCGDQLLCDFHLESHQRSRAFKDHQVFRVSEFAVKALAMTTKRGAAKCTLHEGHAFEHYCQECDQVLCTECRASSHTTHHCLPVREEADHFRNKLDTAMGDMDKGLEDLKVTIDRIASAMKAVTDNTDQAQRDIRGTFAKLRRDLDARERILLQLLEEKQAVKLDSLGRKRVELDHVLGEVEHAFTVADRAMAVLQDSDFVLMAKPVYRKIQGVALSLQEVSGFEVSSESKQVWFDVSERELETVSRTATKLGAVIDEDEEASKPQPPPPPADVQVEFVVVSAAKDLSSTLRGTTTMSRAHPLLNKHRGSNGTEEVVVEVREVLPPPPPATSGAEAGGKGGGKASKAALKANGSKPPEPEAGPLLGRLVLNMPVDCGHAINGGRRYRLTQSFESIDRPDAIPMLRITRGVKLLT